MTLYQHRRALPPKDVQEDGVYVIADAYRFTTTVTMLLANGAAYVRPFLPNETAAIDAFEQNTDGALVRRARPNKAFGVYNSTTYNERFDVTDRPIGIHSTNGSKAVRQVHETHPLYLVSPINARATAAVVKNRHPDATVHLVASGRGSGQEAVEDIVTTGLVQAAFDDALDSTERYYDAIISAARSTYATDKSDAAKQDYERIREFNSVETVPVRNESGDFVATTPDN